MNSVNDKDLKELKKIEKKRKNIIGVLKSSIIVTIIYVIVNIIIIFFSKLKPFESIAVVLYLFFIIIVVVDFVVSLSRMSKDGKVVFKVMLCDNFSELKTKQLIGDDEEEVFRFYFKNYLNNKKVINKLSKKENDKLKALKEIFFEDYYLDVIDDFSEMLFATKFMEILLEINADYSDNNIQIIKSKYEKERLKESNNEFKNDYDKKTKKISKDFYTWNFKLALLVVMLMVILKNIFFKQPTFSPDKLNPQWYNAIFIIYSRIYDNLFNIFAFLLLFIELVERKNDFNFAEKLSQI